MSTAKRLHYTYEDYLRSLELSALKLEFCDGVIYAMAGGTPTHAAISMAVGRVLGQALLGSCTAYSSDLRVRIETTDLSTFPDVTIVCGPIETSSIDANAITNPSILVEVTSPSTEDYDRGDKLSHYKQVPSLQAVLLVSHREHRVTVVSRGGAGWIEREVRQGEVITLASPRLSVPLDAIYEGIALS